MSEAKIQTIIEKAKEGRIFFTEDFKAVANQNQIHVALHRLVKKGILNRIAFGIYTKPILSDYVGEVRPPIEEIAKAIAKRDKARILPTGSYALNRLGLSTQIPLNIVFLTDGPSRKIKIGKTSIRFKKASPRKLALKGDISKLVVLALSEIGSSEVSDEIKKTVIEKLKIEKINDLKHDLFLAPQWIAEIMAKALD